MSFVGAFKGYRARLKWTAPVSYCVGWAAIAQAIRASLLAKAHATTLELLAVWGRSCTSDSRLRCSTERVCRDSVWGATKSIEERETSTPRRSAACCRKPHHLRSGAFFAKHLAARLVLAVKAHSMFAQIDTDQCGLAHDDGHRKQNTL